MTNSRSKGSRGEREWRDFLRDHLHCPEARRGQQYSGSPDSPDVVGGIPGTHVEVKRVERLRLSEAVQQAVTDCGEEEVPYVAHRKNREPWLITIRAADTAFFAAAVVSHLRTKYDGQNLSLPTHSDWSSVCAECGECVAGSR